MPQSSAFPASARAPATASGPRVTVIILNWNGKQDTLGCLRSVAALQYEALRVIVVDNGSEDESVAAIREAFPSVFVMASRTNVGFAEGNNIGIREALNSSDYILLLNNDTLVAPSLLQQLIPVAEADPRIAAAGPAICYADAPETVWCAGLQTGSGRMFGLPVRYTTSILMYCGHAREALPATPYEVDAVVGCAMLLRTPALREIGLLDKALFMIHEDFDWSLRARAHGYRCVIVPEAVIWHKVSSSIKRQDAHRRGQPAAAYYWYRNWLIVVRKHFGFRYMLPVAALYGFRLFPSLVLRDMGQRLWLPSVWVAYGLSLLDAIPGRYKRRFVR
jgi:GT2 family glycosyltransferase